MDSRQHDPFGALGVLQSSFGPVGVYRLNRLEELGLTRLHEMPFSIRVLLEAVLRTCDGLVVTEHDVQMVADWVHRAGGPAEVPFKPARVILQDFTGVPALVDLAAMRSAMHRLGGEPSRIDPQIPVDLVIDHSIQVDYFGSPDALQRNLEMEFQRNRERYTFLRWGEKALGNFHVVPPSVGIIHQVNLEYLAQGVFVRKLPAGPTVVPDTLVGTDSHTTMINALGVLGWGVGGIEAEAVMLGQPLAILLPQVVGVELAGQLPPGATATDLVLAITEMLRKEGVVGKFVEYFGSGVAAMSVPDRATVANMAPEYGATVGFFPVDDQTLAYYRQTGRSAQLVDLVERYSKEQQLFCTGEAPAPKYSKVLRVELGHVEPCIAGPKRPQDRVPLRAAKQAFLEALRRPLAERGFELAESELGKTTQVQMDGNRAGIGHGSVVIAAITSCTNTSNPALMLAAGLVASKAVEFGLRVPGWVKTSLAPGSRVVNDYLEAAGLRQPLQKLGFSVVGYGCTTCIGNSGPLPQPVADAVTKSNLVVAAVLSGNRNFEGRINQHVRANYLASPPLVVAYALAGRMAIDFDSEPLGTARDGRPVFLRDIWPTPEEVARLAATAIGPEAFAARYRDLAAAVPQWNELPASDEAIFPWDSQSTYIQQPPFLLDLQPEPEPVQPILGARVLAALGDSVTTDHISPAGAIPKDSPAGRYLMAQGVPPEEFNSYGSRRGNDRVMVRGTFANIRLRNLLAPGTEGGWTRHLPDGTQMTIYDAAMKYREEGVPLLVLAGREYGTGSSRDWAAKGTYLLGVRAVLAASYERIHRSNLVGMGVLPLELPAGETWQSLGLTGEEVFDLPNLDESLAPQSRLTVRATAADGAARQFPVTVRIDSALELEYYRNGGILQTVLRKLLS